MTAAYVETMRVLLQAALEKCVDAENHSGRIGFAELQRVRLKISIALATLEACGRGRGGQHSAAPP